MGLKVAIGGILHERWTVPAHLEAMWALNTTGLNVVHVWVLDGSVPSVWEDSRAPLSRKLLSSLPGRNYDRTSLTQPSERRAVYGRLATLRNMLADEALRLGADFLLSVDSDILPPPETLMRLLGAAQPWCAALVRNSATDPRCWNVFRLRRVDTDGGLVSHFLPCGNGARGESWPNSAGAGWDPRDPKQERDLAAGACCLYSADLLRKTRWATDHRGRQEDVGFALSAFAAGYRAWYLPIVCQHLTVDGDGLGE